MALMDLFASSFAGMQSGITMLNHASRTLADPATFGYTPTAQPQSFSQVLAAQLSAQVTASREHDQGETGFPPSVYTPAVLPAAPSDLLSGLPPDVMSAMTDMLIAQKLVDANARLISTQNRMLDTLINLGR